MNSWAADGLGIGLVDFWTQGVCPYTVAAYCLFYGCRRESVTFGDTGI